MTDTKVREEDDGNNNINNVLLPEEIETSAVPVIMSGVTPDSTTAALAANVPKANGDLPGTFPDTPGQESEEPFSVDPIPASGSYGNPKSGEENNNTIGSAVTLDKESYEKGSSKEDFPERTFSVNPIPASSGHGNPKLGEENNTIGSAVTLDKESYEQGPKVDAPEQTFSVNPIPASGGSRNPVNLSPGEEVPHHSELHNNTIGSAVTLDKESYEKGPEVDAPEQAFSVNPIPASGGYGNPVSLNPGDKVPHHSELHNNTIGSAVTLDKESYEKGQTLPVNPGNPGDSNDDSAFTLPPLTNNMIPESSLPISGPAQSAASGTEPIYSGGPAQQAAAADPGYTIQSAGPTSTTAALAANVPLEAKGKQTDGDHPVEDVPQVVKDSLAEAHQDPEAAANKTAVEEKKDLEQELQRTVDVKESAGAPAPTVTAATHAVAPGSHLAPGGVDSADVSPTSTPPPVGSAATPIPRSHPTTTGTETVPAAEPTTANPAGPTVTTGAETTQVPASSEAKPAQSPSTEGASTNGDKSEKKKKKRLSGFFHKIKEKLK